MAFNIKPKRNRADTEENISLQKILDSFSGPMMFFLVIVAVIFVMSVFFRVSDIQVEGNTHYTDEEIIRAIDIEEGDMISAHRSRASWGLQTYCWSRMGA